MDINAITGAVTKVLARFRRFRTPIATRTRRRVFARRRSQANCLEILKHSSLLSQSSEQIG